MNRKKLEHAVIMSVLLLTVNNAALAEDEIVIPPFGIAPVEADGEDESAKVLINNQFDTGVIIGSTTRSKNGAIYANNGGRVSVLGNGKLIANFYSEDRNQDADGIFLNNNSSMDLLLPYAEVNVSGDSLMARGIGIFGSEFNSNGILKIDVKGGSVRNDGLFINPAISPNSGSTVNLNSIDITVDGGEVASGIYSMLSSVNAAGDVSINVQNAANENFGIVSYGSQLEFSGNAQITAKGTNSVGVSVLTESIQNTDRTIASNVVFKGNVEINAETAALARGTDSVLTFEKSFVADNGAASQIKAEAGGTVNVNSTGSGIINFKGTTSKDENSTINMNLTDENSVWSMTGDSVLTELVHSNNAVVDMTQDNNQYSTLTVENLSAGNSNGGVIKMDVDGSAANTADRLYINGTHTGNHLISIDNTITETAVGTVLVSVGDEQGTFAAEKTEGALYWNEYDLENEASTESGYNTDWKIAAVKQDEGSSTTSVDTILGANALNYHTWRAENDQLMRRMGELRNNGADEQGAWFRVRGSKISRDDNAAFENKYTAYELGYDQVTKQTEDMTRYTGAALSYTDGSSSYNRGNGENHSKSISLYNTDLYKSGHYLDLVFKFANMDNDFNVHDTYGNSINGEYKNNGISLSAEYGRKNDMKAGWYIEPQAQLTLGYFGGDEYETSNGIKVNQGGIASVLGRIGFNIGKELDDNGVIYAKANLLHEFAGDYGVRMTDSTGISRSESNSFNDTWFEYGIGAALKTGKNNHLYFDFVKTAGGNFEKDWQWNAGMRWTF